MTLIVLYLIGLAGMIGHWAKKVSKDESSSTLWQYVWHNKWHTIGAVATMIAGVSVFIGPDVTLTQASMAGAFVAGFGADSLVNKDKAPFDEQ